MNRIIALAVAASSISLFTASSFGMTAIKNGAQGNAYNNAKSSIDAYNKDPSNSGKACQAAIDPLGISDFQITITYDANVIHVPQPAESIFPPVKALNGYVTGARGGATTGIVSNTVDVGGIGRVTVQGYFQNSTAVPQIDQNTIAVAFRYNNPSVTPPINLMVTPQGSDFFAGLDPMTNQVVFFDAAHILPSETGFFTLDDGPSYTVTPHVVNPGDPPPTPDVVVVPGVVATLDQVYSGRGTQLLGIASPGAGPIEIAFNFSEDALDGRAGDIALLIAQLNLQPPDPVFGPGYDAMLVTSTSANLADFNFSDIFSSARILDLAVFQPPVGVPEPTSMLGLCFAVLPLMRRRR